MGSADGVGDHAHARDSSLRAAPSAQNDRGAEAGWVVQATFVVARKREILRFAQNDRGTEAGWVVQPAMRGHFPDKKAHPRITQG